MFTYIKPASGLDNSPLYEGAILRVRLTASRPVSVSEAPKDVTEQSRVIPVCPDRRRPSLVSTSHQQFTRINETT